MLLLLLFHLLHLGAVSPFLLAVPSTSHVNIPFFRTLCFGVSFVGFMTVLLQVSLYHSRRLWGRRFFVLNVMTTLLWVAVIAIGWVWPLKRWQHFPF
jgi:hypothetical protein